MGAHPGPDEQQTIDAPQDPTHRGREYAPGPDPKPPTQYATAIKHAAPATGR